MVSQSAATPQLVARSRQSLGARDSLDHLAAPGTAGAVTAVRAAAPAAVRADVLTGPLGTRGRLIPGSHLPGRRRTAGPRLGSAGLVLVHVVSAHSCPLPKPEAA